MVDSKDLIIQLQQARTEFLKNYCVINGAVWPLEQIENMGLREYATRSIYSMPLKFYKYFRDEEDDKDGNVKKVNYSQIALESNEVYLSSPTEFDDVFDSEIVVPWPEFEDFRFKTYAHWCKCNITKEMSREEIDSVFIQYLSDIYSKNGSFDEAFTMSEQGELAKGRIDAFVLRLKIELINNGQLDIAIKNAIAHEYHEFINDLKQKFRVACFTTTPASQLMWGGRYANEHKGFCLEYSVKFEKEYEDVIHNIYPVVYCKTRTPVTKALLDTYDNNWNMSSLSDLYFNGALRKSIDWAFQNEWRLLLPPQQYGESGFTIRFFPITKVYLGNRMVPTRRKEIIDICKRKGIPYTGVTRSSELFEMQECDILCENCLHLNEQK